MGNSNIPFNVKLSYDSFMNIETLEKALIQSNFVFYTHKLDIGWWNFFPDYCTIRIRPIRESSLNTMIPYYKSYKDICATIMEMVSKRVQEDLTEKITDIYITKAESKIEELVQNWPLEKIKEKYYYNHSLYGFWKKCMEDHKRLHLEGYNIIWKEFHIDSRASKLSGLKEHYLELQKEREQKREWTAREKLMPHIIDLSKLGFATPPDLFDYEKASVEELKEILKNARAKQQEYLEHVFRVGNSIKEKEAREIQQEEGSAAAKN